MKQNKVFYTVCAGAIKNALQKRLPASGYVMDRRYGLNIYLEMDESRDRVAMELCIPIQ